MRIRDFLRFFPEYSRRPLAYVDYLERQGLTFLVDFGFDNAERIAWEHLEAGDYLLGHA